MQSRRENPIPENEIHCNCIGKYWNTGIEIRNLYPKETENKRLIWVQVFVSIGLGSVAVMPNRQHRQYRLVLSSVCMPGLRCASVSVNCCSISTVLPSIQLLFLSLSLIVWVSVLLWSIALFSHRWHWWQTFKYLTKRYQ